MTPSTPPATPFLPGDGDERILGVLNSISDGFCAFDKNWRFTFVNAAARRMFALYIADSSSLMDRTLWEAFPATVGTELEREYRRAVAEGVPVEVEALYSPWGRWFHSRAFPIQGGGLSVYLRDTTMEKQVAGDLSATEERFHAMADAIPQLAWTARPDGFTHWYNRRWYEYTGTTPKDMEGWGWQKVHDPEMLPKVLERWNACIASGEIFDMVFPLRGADGKFRSFLTRVTPLKDASGRVTQWCGTNTDVDELKRAETALRKSEERFRGVFEFAATGIALIDKAGRFLQCNPAYCNILGYTEEQLRHSTLASLMHFEASQVGVTAVQRMLEKKASHFEMEHRYATKGGKIIWLQEYVSLLRGESGDAESFLALVTDVTERRLSEEALMEASYAALGESEERFRSAFDNAPIGMSLVGTNGRWLRVNRALCDMLGYSESQLLATDFQHITHPEDLDRDLELVRQVLAGDIRSYQMEKRYFHQDGDIVHVLLSASLVRDEAGAPSYFISQVLNITERKKAERFLKDSLDEKETLLKEVHHRVKNNLQVISSLLQLQSSSLAEPRLLRLFREAQDRVRAMALVHECLYRSGNMAAVNFGDHVKELAGNLLRSYNVGGAPVKLETEADPARLDIDVAVPLSLIVNELVTNALKHAFAEGRGGTLRVRFRALDNRMLSLSIADDGPGLAEGYDLEKSAAIGLKVVRILVNQIRGRMEAVSSPGATFTITFPRSRRPPMLHK